MTTADAHAHDHPEFLAHHWDNPGQQFEAGKLGMWLFLATEVLLFGGLFCAYTIWRFNHPEMFKFGSTFLDTKWGAINTAVLVTSSLTMAMGVTMAQRGNTKALVICLVLTLAGAFGFLGIKYIEYSHKFHEGFLPGLKFYQVHDHAHSWDPQRSVSGLEHTVIDPASTALTVGDLGLPQSIPVEMSTVGPSAEAPAGVNLSVLTDMEKERHGEGAPHRRHGHADEHASDHAGDHAGDLGHGPLHAMQSPERPPNAHMFFNIYFMMTGLHGIHVIIGGIVIAWLLVGALRGRFNSEYFTPVDLGGLYWHVVDLIWIFLFPLFYLI